MEINRRSLLKGALTASFIHNIPSAWAADDIAYVTTGRTADRSYLAYMLGHAGEIISSFPLDHRCHGIATSTDIKTAVIFSRRPGRFATVLNLVTKKPEFSFTPPDNRRFYGHGVFSKEGQFLFATENDFRNEKGVLGIYDASDHFRRIGEIDSGGIGPHEIILSHDGKTLIVANGGILTHPDYPRQKLNLPDMEPSIAFIDVSSREIETVLTLSTNLHQVSLRHLAGDKTGNIWIGGQYQGPKSDPVPLFFKINRQRRILEALNLPTDSGLRLKQYIGSVATNEDGSRVAFSAPRGDLVSIWECATKREVQQIKQTDACGLAGLNRDFLVSAGDGSLFTSAGVRRAHTINWDNHMTAL
ncbi:MAG: DUF1513 domain-containing protein [Sneathiella sp.]|nr:DUF1513 domain-containing protein [Sneathiella sp.]